MRTFDLTTKHLCSVPFESEKINYLFVAQLGSEVVDEFPWIGRIDVRLTWSHQDPGFLADLEGARRLVLLVGIVIDVGELWLCRRSDLESLQVLLFV